MVRMEKLTREHQEGKEDENHTTSCMHGETYHICLELQDGMMCEIGHSTVEKHLHVQLMLVVGHCC